SYINGLKAVTEQHEATSKELLSAEKHLAFQKAFAKDIADVTDVLKATWTLKAAGEPVQELVSGYGEIWSARLLAAHLQDTKASSDWIDARQIIFVEPSEAGPVVLWEHNAKAVEANSDSFAHDIAVFTGYIASFIGGVPTTLKRNGSDWSSAIMAKLLKAKSLTIWKEVDGVMSADPRIVPEAFMLHELSYKEANELAFFGAKVLHPKTMAPAMDEKIPIWIRNSYRPQDKGTLIHFTDGAVKPADAAHAVKGFALVDHVAVLNLEGTGMMGVPGIAQRLFGSLREVSVSVIMISQASSEQSICFAVPFDQSKLAHDTVAKAFFSEIHHGLIQKVEVSEKCSILAAVGDNMVHTPGVSATLFKALASAGVNVRAIAQGSSERNISVVVAHSDRHRALRAAHSGFYLSEQTISLTLVGPGLIGKTLLQQLGQRLAHLKSKHRIDIRVRAIANSKKMLLSDEPLNLDTWERDFEKSAVALDYDALLKHAKPFYFPHAVILDCTASDSVASLYKSWLSAGVHVVTPNKKANSRELSYYNELHELKSRHRAHYLYSTTVGAGLPVISTLKDLVQTGDKILKIEGILSGTLSYIFNTIKPGMKFSSVVLDAKAKGYTEPDPRDDLSGTDVARKLTILAREMGEKIELSDAKVESLVPEPLRALKSADEFLTRIHEFDSEFEAKLVAADNRGEVLRFVGVLEPGAAPSVKLGAYPKSHAFARISGSDNIVSFTTERYLSQPLIVQGPGAGPEVLAAGAFADLLRLASYLGAVK
ncbi:MAG: bifunctional aspartate kinase/homoserine dehydrogenase I, partial [Bdellovibrionia bacterium]